MRPVQSFTSEYLNQCKKMSTGEILEFLESFRLLHTGSQAETKSRLISMKIPEAMLVAFKTKARLLGVPYQTQIKSLMKRWLE